MIIIIIIILLKNLWIFDEFFLPVYVGEQMHGTPIIEVAWNHLKHISAQAFLIFDGNVIFHMSWGTKKKSCS